MGQRAQFKTRPEPHEAAGQKRSSPAMVSRRTRRSRHPDSALQPPATDAGRPVGQRLQKVLAAAGIGSRRQCEELIRTGRVEVDCRVVTELGVRVDPRRQEIRVDGQVVRQPARLYVAVHKPEGVVCTHRDPAGRPRVIDLVPTAENQRLFPVGRLDLHSEGLILLTNDGELANRLAHPRYGVEKTYRAVVAGSPSQEVLDRLLRGVHLAEGVARASRIAVKRRLARSTILEITLREGKNREIRRIFAGVGHKVLRLLRLSVGPVRLGKLRPGQWRPLTPQEITALRKAARH